MNIYWEKILSFFLKTIVVVFLSDLMLLNRATNSTAVDIYNKIYNDNTSPRETFLHIRHEKSKSKGLKLPYDRSISKRSGSFIHDESSITKNTSSSSWIDGLLGGKSKHGVFTADFLDDNGTIVTVRDGETAMLNCSVYLRHNKTVSWLHHRGDTIDLLTVGDLRYSGDERINISIMYPNNYRLIIQNIRKEDQGVYVCQIASFPPKALTVNINVIDAIVEMVDNEGNPMSNQYYNPGSEIELACIIRNRSLWSTEVKWLKDDEPVDLHHSPSVSVGTQIDADRVVSRLRIQGATNKDTGNYTCRIGDNAFDFPRGRVKVHVVDGDFHAAVHGGVNDLRFVSSILALTVIAANSVTAYLTDSRI